MITLREACRTSPQLGLLYSYPAPGIIERIAKDWDWIWIDGQHGQLDYSDILAAVRACNAANRPAVVRVPDHAYGTIGKVLDTAPDGIMVPLIDTAEQAREVVRAVKFPPTGNRSYGARRVIDLHGRCYEDGYDNPVLIAQIETRTAVENLDQIAAVEGVDCLFIGLDDMAMRDGADMSKIDQDQYDPMLEKVAAAAKKHNQIAAGVFTTIPRFTKAVRMGFSLMCAAGDVGLLAGASAETSSRFKNHLEQMNSDQSQPGDSTVKNSSVY
jgi:4-hydroxy-2-oxoheptanedioate aldolase